MELDYIAIGRRIRTARKELKLTQENVSEQVNLSVPHLSHIECGRTKVSLSSLICIANALHTTVDSLLYDNIEASRDAYDKDFKDLLSDCSEQEKNVILTAAEQVKAALKTE